METLNNSAKANLEYKLAIYHNPEQFLTGYTREQWVFRQERILSSMERLYRPIYDNEIQATKQFLNIIKNKMKNYNTLPKHDFILTSSQEFANISNLLEAEILKAEEKHPAFARTLPDALLVISEELGEAQRAYLQYAYERKPFEEIRKELIQTGAMVFRTLLNLDGFVVDAGQDIPMPNHVCKPMVADLKPCEPSLNKSDYTLQAEAYMAITGQSHKQAATLYHKWYLRRFLNVLKSPDTSGIVLDKHTINYHKDEPLVGLVEYEFFNYLYDKKPLSSFLDESGVTIINARKNRILFTREYEGITQDAAACIGFEAWVSARRPVGFAFSHSVAIKTPEGKVKRTVVYKASEEANLPW